MDVREAPRRQRQEPVERNRGKFMRVLLSLHLALMASSVAADEGDEFFEKRIRPVLVEHCHECHAGPADELSGELDLTQRAGLMAGGESGPALVPRRPEQSLLLRALSHTDGKLAMPPDEKLPDRVLEDFEKWIRLGAPWPGESTDVKENLPASKFKLTDEDRNYWAFQPLPRDERATIDGFVSQRLQDAGIEASPPADRRTLIRRLSYDLTGMPPNPERVEQFAADVSPDAVETLVDELLASESFGTHWARLWLDQVRFDAVPGSGPYRAWVVAALNADMPYDEFLKRQVAGDLLPSASPDEALANRIATGFWSFGVAYGDGDLLEVASNLRDEQIDLLGRSVLGLTLACARCHDHKFDPISQADYYALAGIFKSSHAHMRKNYRRMEPEMSPLLTDVQAVERYWQERQQIQQCNFEADRIERDNNHALRLRRLTQKIEKEMARELASEAERLERDELLEETRLEVATLQADMRQRGWSADEKALDRMRQLRARAAALQKKHDALPLHLAMREGGIPGYDEDIADVALLIRGNPRMPGSLVPRGTPAVLGEFPKISQGSGRRELAQWLVTESSPITARVMANRVWGHLLGTGIVATPDNFGRLGSPPTHPQLLDHLAARLIDSGWSVKKLIRDVVMSETYRRSSRPTASARSKDPDNRLLSHRPRKRLTAEQIADTLAFWKGDLHSEQDRVLWSDVQRRKDSALRALEVFDGSDPRALTPNRADTTASPQALFMLNNELPVAAARALAEQTAEGSLEQRIDRLHRVLFARPATEAEIPLGRELVAGFAEEPWRNYCHALLCANETIYLD